jgi:hypothetical protein
LINLNLYNSEKAEGMAELVKLFNWSYVATISEEGNSGSINAFIENIKKEKSNGSYFISFLFILYLLIAIIF